MRVYALVDREDDRTFLIAECGRLVDIYNFVKNIPYEIRKRFEVQIREYKDEDDIHYDIIHRFSLNDDDYKEEETEE